jgi:GDP-mannose 6-dehydrogenase
VKVVVFGLGYVGTVTAACLAAPDRNIVGVDPDDMKVELVRAGCSPVVEPGLEELLADAVAKGWVQATSESREALDGADVALLCVGTPSRMDGSVNLAYIERAAAEIGTYLRGSDRFLCVVVRSTVPPGTVLGLVAPAIEAASGKRAGTDFGVAMCPEFLREGSGVADFFDPPFIAIGAEDARTESALVALFSDVDRPVHVTAIRVAEGLKYACNAYHAVKISFVNEIGRLCQAVGIDTRSLMSIFSKDDRLNISTAYLRPGFAYGGSCLPKDLRALHHLARQLNVDTPLLLGTSYTNDLVVRELVRLLIDLPTRDVALLGLSFKPQTDDLRESPYVELAEQLIGKGIQLRIYDPIVRPDALFGANRRYVEDRLPHLHRLLVPTPAEALLGVGAAVVASPQPEVVAALLDGKPPMVVDLVGTLGADVEALPGYRGGCW